MSRDLLQTPIILIWPATKCPLVDPVKLDQNGAAGLSQGLQDPAERVTLFQQHAAIVTPREPVSDRIGTWSLGRNWSSRHWFDERKCASTVRICDTPMS